MSEEYTANAAACPFCGSTSVHVRPDSDHHDTFVECRQCHAFGPSARTQDEALSRWNSRGQEDPAWVRKITPGPWHDDGYRIYAPTDQPDPRSGRVIVEYKHVDDFNYADAALIAAAPDLLAACEAAREELITGQRDGAFFLVEEAIKKARKNEW